MQTLCQKCGTPAASDQAFCSRCGAVLGMADDAGGAAPDLAATMVGKKLPITPPPPRPPAPQHPAAPPRQVAAPPAAATPRPPSPARGNLVLILVAVGFVLVTLVGVLLLLFFLLGRG